MRLKVKLLGLEIGGKPIVILNKEDAEEIGVHSSGRVCLQYNKKQLTAIVNVTTTIIPKGSVGVTEEVNAVLILKDNVEVDVEIAKFPSSLQFIRLKLKGRKLSYDEILTIVKDVVEGNLSETEISAFVAALDKEALTLDEAASLSIAMVETGQSLKLDRKIVVDKHCLPEDIPTIVRNCDNVKIENIGSIIDSILDKCDEKEIVYDGESEFTNKNLSNLHVLTHDDNGKIYFVPVSGVFRVKSPKFLQKIVLVGNREIKTTLNHSIFVLKNGKIINVPARDIKIGDYVIIPSGMKKEKFIRSISIEEGLKENIRNYRKFKKEIEISPEFMRFLGYYISEGFINYQGIFLNFGSHEEYLIEDCIKCVEKVFGIKPTINKPHRTAVRICIYSQILSKAFQKIIKAGCNSSDKRIPWFIFDVNDEMKIKFLQALFKGDGYVRRGYEAIYITSSKKLSTDIQYLLSILGISTSITKKDSYERFFPIGNGKKQKSKVNESYYVYTQAREIFGGRKGTNVAFNNLLPIKQLGEIETKDIGWHFRRELKRKKYITKDKLHRIIDKIKSDDVKKFIKGDISVLRVKKVEMIPSYSKYVYDFKIDGYNRFVAGSAPICIHNSIGGCAGDKTTLLVVPIIAATGLTIPKTSSRAITSAAGTGDRAEVLMPVDLGIEEMKDVVEKTNGCIVWGGSLNLAPADDIFIKAEYPLSIDPLMLPSIMSKKKAINITHLVVDIPTGRGTKVKTIGDANLLAKDFIELGKMLSIHTQCAITYGEQPVGYTIGPALEAKEALEVLMNKKNVVDLIDKATHIADILLHMVGKDGQKTALNIIKQGKAEQKLREIIAAQGGDSEIKPGDIKIGEYGLDFQSDKKGIVLWIDNASLIEIARAAGSPKDKGAGVELYKKLGDSVKKGEKLFTIYAEKSSKLERIRKILEENEIFGVGETREMLIEEVKEVPLPKKSFILER